MAEEDDEDGDDGAYDDDDFEDEGDELDGDLEESLDGTRSYSDSISKSQSLVKKSSMRGSRRLLTEETAQTEEAAQNQLAAAVPAVRRRPRVAESPTSATVAGQTDGYVSSAVASGIPPTLPPAAPTLPPAVTRRQGSFAAVSSSTNARPDPLDIARGGGSAGSGGSNRVVRAKISVTAEDRPPTGESGPSPTTHQAQGSSKPSVPVWLQFNNNGPQHSRDNGRARTPRMSDPHRTGSRGPGDRPPHGPLSSGDHFVDGHGPGRPGSHGPRRGDSSPTPRRGHDADFDCGGGGGGGGSGDAERKVKRLQQEVQRLSQRLKEAELWSQDDLLPKFTLDEVEVGCQIAQGGFSSVHHAMWRCTPCALKKIFDPVITEELKSEFENEVRMLKLLRHPHVVCLMAVCRVPPALSVLTEIIGGGSVFELLHTGAANGKRFCIKAEPPAVLPLIFQASGAVAYMHSMAVVHRDIKSQNVLLTEGSAPIAKLCDFGLARMRSELCTGTMQWAGTACYMAPELFSKRKYTDMVDVFAFGTMIWEVASTEIPHANMDPADIAHRVQSKDGACLTVANYWPKSLKALLKTALAVQPEGRPSMVEVVKQLDKVMLDFPAPD